MFSLSRFPLWTHQRPRIKLSIRCFVYTKIFFLFFFFTNSSKVERFVPSAGRCTTHGRSAGVVLQLGRKVKLLDDEPVGLQLEGEIERLRLVRLMRRQRRQLLDVQQAVVLLEHRVGLLVDVVERLEIDVHINKFADLEDQLIVDEIDEMKRHRQEADDVLVVPDERLQLRKEPQNVVTERLRIPKRRSHRADANPQQIVAVVTGESLDIVENHFKGRLRLCSVTRCEVGEGEEANILVARDLILVDLLGQIEVHSAVTSALHRINFGRRLIAKSDAQVVVG